jgi:hypothetical protein
MKKKTGDAIFEAIESGQNTPEILAFLKERASAARAAIKATKAEGRSGMDFLLKLRTLQVSPKMLRHLRWSSNSLTEIATDLDEMIKDLDGQGRGAGTSSGTASTTKPAARSDTLPEIRQRIRNETDPIKRGQLARQARDLREAHRG